MQFPSAFSSPGVRAKLATLLFLIAWPLGSIALMGVLEVEAGLPGLSAFAIACALWWGSYRISLSAGGRGVTLGFIALGMWMLALVGALLINFHDYVRNGFFWASTLLLSLLVAAVALSDAPSGGADAAQGAGSSEN